MKKTSKASPQLHTANLETLRKLTGPVDKMDSQFGLLLLIADMMDEIAKGRNMYMVIGSTQNGSAFSVTVKGEDAPAPMYGAWLGDLGTQALDLL